MTLMQIPTQCYSYELQAACYIDQLRYLHHTGKWFSFVSTYHSLNTCFKKNIYTYIPPPQVELYVLYDLHSKQKLRV